MDIIAFCSRNCLLMTLLFQVKKKCNLQKYNNTCYTALHPVLYFYLLVLFVTTYITSVWGGFCGLFLCVFNPTHHFNSKIGRGLEYVHMYLVTLLTDNLRIPSMFFFMSVRNLHIMSNYYNYKHFVY